MIVGMLCIVPPHLLNEIASRGDELLKQWALATISLSESVRSRRQTFAFIIPGIAKPAKKERFVYDAEHDTSLPGKLVRREGDNPTKDVAVNEAYDGAGWTYDLYQNIYSRNSIDDRGLRMDSTVHYSENYDNAFWNGDQMVYGDGDGRIFNRFTKAIDVIGHELTHGVTQYTARLEYQGQSGALNEHISDVFGSLVKQYSLSQTADTADWLIGQGLFTPSIHGEALRSMKAPGTAYDDPLIGRDPQPAHMKDYVNTFEDNGGVHINSGIPNHAFYLAATAIGGNSWEKTGRIWYVTLFRLKSNSGFEEMAQHTFNVAGELFGAGKTEQNAVKKAWAGVGISIKK